MTQHHSHNQELNTTSTVDFASAAIGSASHNTDFDTTGHQTMTGDAKPWRDALGELLAKKRTGARITEDLVEGTLVFSDSCQVADDYVIINLQLNHDRELQGNLYPHVHWFQASANTPNWIIYYRWHENGLAKTTAWSPLKWLTNSFAWSTGTILQISKFGTISPPLSSGVSPILQVRLTRDTDDDSTLFGIADPVAGSVHALSFDCHLQINSLGSTDEYSK